MCHVFHHEPGCAICRIFLSCSHLHRNRWKTVVAPATMLYIQIDESCERACARVGENVYKVDDAPSECRTTISYKLLSREHQQYHAMNDVR